MIHTKFILLNEKEKQKNLIKIFTVHDLPMNKWQFQTWKILTVILKFLHLSALSTEWSEQQL